MRVHLAQARKATVPVMRVKIGSGVGAAAGSEGSDPGAWGFPKIRGTILGVPIIRTIVTIVYWGL